MLKNQQTKVMKKFIHFYENGTNNLQFTLQSKIYRSIFEHYLQATEDI